MTNIQKLLEKETNQSLLHNKSGNGLINNFKASKNTITDLNLVQDGDSTLPPGRRIHLPQRTGSNAATGSQIEAGICGKHHPGLNSNFSSLFRDIILLAGNLTSWQSTEGVDRHTYRAPHFLMHSCWAVSFRSLVVRVYSHHMNSSAHMRGSRAQRLETEAHLCVAPQNTSYSSRHVLHLADLDTTHEHSFLTFSRTSLPTFCTTLPRSTAAAAWRPDGNTTSHRICQDAQSEHKHDAPDLRNDSVAENPAPGRDSGVAEIFDSFGSDLDDNPQKHDSEDGRNDEVSVLESDQEVEGAKWGPESSI